LSCLIVVSTKFGRLLINHSVHRISTDRHWPLVDQTLNIFDWGLWYFNYYMFE